MKPRKKARPAAGCALRQNAEKSLAARPYQEDQDPPRDEKALLHELRIHQVELEMQNEELRKAQGDLESSRSRYSDLYENAPVGYLTFDRLGRVLEANFTAARMLNLEKPILEKTPFAAFLDPEFREPFRRHLHQVLGDGREERCEIRVLRRDGAPFFAALRSVPFSEGGAGRCRSALIDITDRKEAEERARAEHAFRRAVEESLLSGILAVDLEGRQTYANSAFCRMVGWTRNELLGGKPPFVFWPPEESDALSEVTREILSGSRAAGSLEVTLRRKNGARFAALVLFSPLKGPRGEQIGWVASVGDITASKEREEEIRRLNTELEERVRRRTAELEEANRELQDFTSAVTHDLRTPLLVLSHSTQRLVKGYFHLLDDRGREYVERVSASIGMMEKIIDALQRLSGIIRTTLSREPLDLGPLARSIREDLERLEPGRRVEWVIGEGLRAEGDPHLLRIALENLIRNAWKFSRNRPESRIEVGSLPGGDGPVFFVRDNGCGFDMARAKELFVPFQRLHREKEFEGTGVGLATVKRIMDRHHGRIWAESDPDRGTTFFFSLGKRDTPLERRERKSRPGEAAGRKKILLADDEENLRRIYQEELEEEGFEVTPARDGREAVRAFEETDFDLVVLDIAMPEMDGIEALGRLKSRKPRIPVILHTAHSHYRDDPAARAADALLTKAGSLENLKSAIRHFLGQSGAP